MQRGESLQTNQLFLHLNQQEVDKTNGLIPMQNRMTLLRVPWQPGFIKLAE